MKTMEIKFSKASLMTVVMMFMTFFAAQAQQLDANTRTTANTTWTTFMWGVGFAILITFVIGLVVLYSKKNEPQEFRKYLIGFIVALVVLFVGLGCLALVQSATTKAASSVSF